MTAIDLDPVQQASDALFAPDAPHGISLALVVMQRGDVVFERYGVQPDTIFGPGGPVDADTTLISWSMAKSITHAAVGILARAMQSMAIRGFIVHDRESGACALTDSERATLAVILKNAGLAPK